MSRNVVNDYIEYSKKTIKSYIKLVMGNEFNNTYFERILNCYINTRYYNLYDIVSNNLENTIHYYVKNVALKLIEENPKDKKKIGLMYGLFQFVIYFDDVDNSFSLENIIIKINHCLNCNLPKELEKQELLELLKENSNTKKKYLELFDSNNFYLNKKKTNILNLEDVELVYDIKFPKLYSEYAIDKASKKGAVKEDKIFIEYYLVGKEVLENVIAGNFNKKYLVDFDLEINEKKSKWSRMLNILDSEIVKENVHFKISYTLFEKNKSLINSLIHDGFNFALIIDDGYIGDLLIDNSLAIFSYLIVSENKNIYKGIGNIVIL